MRESTPCGLAPLSHFPMRDSVSKLPTQSPQVATNDPATPYVVRRRRAGEVVIFDQSVVVVSRRARVLSHFGARKDADNPPADMTRPPEADMARVWTCAGVGRMSPVVKGENDSNVSCKSNEAPNPDRGSFY